MFISTFASLTHFYYNSDVTDVYCIINNNTQTWVKVFVMVTAGLSTVFQTQSVISKYQNINVRININAHTLFVRSSILRSIAILNVTSLIVINVPTGRLLTVKAKHSFLLCLAKFKNQRHVYKQRISLFYYHVTKEETSVRVLVYLNSDNQKLHLDRRKFSFCLPYRCNSVHFYPSVKQRDSLRCQYSQ